MWYLCYADRAMKEKICNTFFFYIVNPNIIHDFPYFLQCLIETVKILLVNHESLILNSKPARQI